MSSMEQRNSTDLRGQVAIVTGASSGIGESVAELLVKCGVHVALSARREDRINALAGRLTGEGYGETLVVPSDVRNPEDVEALVRKTLERWGHLDIVIANAGFGYRAPIVEGDIQRWKDMLDTNVYGLLLTLRYGVPPLLEQGHGHVIVTSSIAGRSVTAGGSAYSGSKFAANAIAESLRQEVGAHGVRVTTIEPGTVWTEFAEVAGYSPETRATLQQLQPLKPEDIANGMLYALEQPSYVDVAELTIYPTRQTGQGVVAR
jgi:NADP-dependent 3-hydroxy acid dehydrogenase YdfG